ncbi:MAG: DNA alkylation repair protein [Rikenellaceae bacterium]|nr:DNA alkylation repair protein [Rikenellaceae bacterium]
MDRLKKIIEWMGTLRNQKSIEGMQRFGITTGNAFGISTPTLAAMARELGRDQPLAIELWDTGIREARILAAMVADPAGFTPDLMDRWCADFNSWDICDQVCTRVFRYTPYADEKIHEWARSEEEYVRRAAFALIAATAVSDKKAPDCRFEAYLPLIIEAGEDDRNFVRKAVNWALRQIGKRSPGLWFKAIATAEELMVSPNKTSRWIGSDATRELTGEKVIRRLDFGQV